MTFTKKHMSAAFDAHNDTLTTAIGELWENKHLTRTGAIEVADTLAAGVLLPLAREMGRDPNARKRVNNFLAHQGATIAPLVWKGKEGRQVGHCYLNAFKEFKETGNPIAYGWIDGSTLRQDYFNVFIPHAFNRDKETGQYYDTTFFAQDIARATKPVFIITPLVKAVAKHDPTENMPGALDKTVGGWVFLTHRGKTYALQGWEHYEDGDKTQTHYKRMRVAEVM